jgi:MFS superfamily sulfate permease-like transporter
VKERIIAIAIYVLPIVYGLIPAMLGVFVFAFFKAPFQKNVIAAGSLTFLLLTLLVLAISHALAKQHGDVARTKL